MSSSDSSPLVHLNVGGKKFCTTLDTLTVREPESILAKYHTLRLEKGEYFIDRDAKHFRHILNWLRDGVVPTLHESIYPELLREAEYYQIMGMIDGIQDALNKRESESSSSADLTRADILKKLHTSPPNAQHNFHGYNLSGIDLSKLNLSRAKFTKACLKNTRFSDATLQFVSFVDADTEGAIFDNADLIFSNFLGANLHGASFAGARMYGAALYKDDQVNVNLEGAKVEGMKLFPKKKSRE